MSTFSRYFFFTLLLGATVQAATDAEIERRFRFEVRPLLDTYCVACHGERNAAAQFDLKQYRSAADTVRDHSRWTLLMEKVASGDMPPKGLKQPTEAERKSVVEWVEAMRRHEAAKNAGDPGPVLVRRLSNAEYNYTIRDLTGVDIRPTREFPLDPVNPEGFDNSGESLAMSPALLNKYLQAAREVANHLVLRPGGFDFAPHPMLAETDREKYTIQRIVAFYDRQPTDYADYFEAAWLYKHRAALEKPDATLASVASDRKISAKYLPLVWGILEDPIEDAGPIAKLRSMWRLLPPPAAGKQPELVREGCLKMRDYTVRIRQLTARQFATPMVQGLNGASQPIMAWKLHAFASHRRDFDRKALQVEGEPAPMAPKIVMGRGPQAPPDDVIAVRNEGLAIKARFGHPDLLVPAGERERYETAFAKFASVFPDAFYIRERGRFYPDDSEDKGRLLSAGFHNVMGYFRDDTPLQELILDEAGKRELDRLWDEFDYVADYTTRTYIQFFFNQSGEIDGRGRESGSFRPGDVAVTSEKTIFSLRDAYLAKAAPSNNPVANQSIKDHFARVNAAIRAVEKARRDAEPTHLDALLDFAARAYRRPLRSEEREELLAYYRSLRTSKSLTHEDAMRDMIALVLMSPDFSYRVDLSKVEPVPAIPRPKARPLSGPALATKLSYFLWASMPDETLMQLGASGELKRPEVLAEQVRRMLKDERAKTLAIDFAGHWLDYRRFETHSGVDRTKFPAFTDSLRQAMFDEPVRLIDDAIRHDRSALDLLYGTHTFVNAELARHYGMEGIRPKDGDWVRVDDARPYGRGGLLPMGVFLTQSSPGLRTSPVKRGYWVARRVLGEVIPPPPPSVPELPDDESKMNLPLREMLKKHRENASCAACHARFDSFGLTMEGYGPIGERRKTDLGGRAIEERADFPNGKQGDGIEGLRQYIRDHREKDFVHNLCRKMLAYALGRSLLLSDEPLLDDMKTRFVQGGHRFSILIESVVKSPQFLNARTIEVSQRREK